MGLWGKDSDHDGRFALDDEIWRKLDDMSNKDEAIELMDVLGKNQESLEHAIDALVALDRAGAFSMLQAFAEDDADIDTADWAPGIQQVNALLQLTDQIDMDLLENLMAQLPDGEALDMEELADPPQVGPMQALQQFRDPDVQRGIGRVLVLLKALGKQ